MVLGTKPFRPKVVRITVEMEYPDGTKKTIEVDPSQYTAMFWNDSSVLDILGGFYDRQPSKMTRLECERHFGPDRAAAVLGPAQDLKIDRAAVERLWNAADSNGEQVAVMFKTHVCIPGG